MALRNLSLGISFAIAAATLVGCGGDGDDAGGVLLAEGAPASDERNGVAEDPVSKDDASGDGATEPVVTTIDGVALMVSGTLDLSSRSIELVPTRSLPTERSLTPDPGPFQLDVESVDGTALAQVSFDVITQADSDPPSARFNVAVQPQPADPIGRLRISYLGDEVGVIEGSPSTPTVEVVAPSPELGPVAVDDVTIQWRADDADGDPLSFAVFFSPDDGVTWTSVVTRTTEQELRPVPGILEPTDRARVLVTASDGVNASFAISEVFELSRS